MTCGMDLSDERTAQLNELRELVAAVHGDAATVSHDADYVSIFYGAHEPRREISWRFLADVVRRYTELVSAGAESADEIMRIVRERHAEIEAVRAKEQREIEEVVAREKRCRAWLAKRLER